MELMNVSYYTGNLNIMWDWIKDKTNHLSHRETRLRKISKLGFQKVLCAFEVDRGHFNGPEIHFITDKGIIYIFNRDSHCFVTALIARPNQVLRYFKKTSTTPKKPILNMLRQCKAHEKAGLNHIN